MGGVLALCLVSLSIAPPDLASIRWIICGVGLLLIMLLTTGWARPRRQELDLRQRLRRAMAQRDEVERYFEALMDSLPSNIYFKDRESKFVCANQSIA